MDKCTYKNLDNPLIPNTEMKILLIDGTETTYYITAKDGYKLHAKELDEIGFDEELMKETDEIIPGFTTGIKTCAIDYDFDKNPREFYTEEIQEVKSDEELI